MRVGKDFSTILLKSSLLVLLMNMKGCNCNGNQVPLIPLPNETVNTVQDTLNFVRQVQKVYAGVCMHTSFNAKIGNGEEDELKAFEQYSQKYKNQKIDFFAEEINIAGFMQLASKEKSSARAAQLKNIGPENMRKILVQLIQNFFEPLEKYGGKATSSQHSGAHALNARTLSLALEVAEEWLAR